MPTDPPPPQLPAGTPGRPPVVTEARDLATVEPSAIALRDGGRRSVHVSPDEVWQPPPPPPPAAWVQRSFFAPIAGVVAISAALLYGLLAVVGLLWRWLG